MAPLPEASEIYNAVGTWVLDCLLRDGSVFMPEKRLWSLENIQALREAFTGKPIQGEAKFEEKFRQQLQDHPPEVAMLGAEMLWVLFLFPRKTMLPQRKRELIQLVWSWAGRELDPGHPMLSDTVMAGIGNAGTAFSTQRDRELEGLIDAVTTIKDAGEELVPMEPQAIGKRIDAQPRTARRNIRNILLHLMYPNAYERIASSAHKRLAVRALAGLVGQEPVTAPMVGVDLQLLEIRSKLQERSPERQIDFYDPEILPLWNPPSDTAKPRKQRKVTAEAERIARLAASDEAYEVFAATAVVEAARQVDAAAVAETQKSVEQPGVAFDFVDGESANYQARLAVATAHYLARRAKRPQLTPDLFFASFIALSGRGDYDSPATAAVYASMRETLANVRGTLAAQTIHSDPARLLLARYGIDPRFEPPLETAQTWPGPALAPILDAADQLRTRVGKPRLLPLSPRHILAVLLLPGAHSAAPVLAELGFEPAGLRAALFEALDKQWEDHDEWRQILLGVGEGKPTPDAAVYAGFSTDALRVDETAAITRKDDRLNVMRDVTALSEVLAARGTQPPLAVGLFGDWGTGKSFFMELMRQEIELLGQQNPDFYCERVVQVWFNAWHYMESNLWASLAARVFEALAEQLEKWELPKDQRAELFERLQESQGVLAEAVSERSRVDARIEALRAERARKESSFADTAANAFRAATAALSADPEVQQKLRDAKEKLGLTAAQADVETAGEQVRQLRTLGGRVAAIARAFVQRPVLLVGIVGFAAVAAGATWLLDHFAIFSEPARAVAAVAAWVAALGAAVAPATRQVSRGVRWLDDVATRLQQQRDSEQRQEELALQRDLMRLDERQREAQAQVDALNREIEDLRAGRRLQRFILERHTSAEYRQHLGLVNLIRNDFERLSKLLLESQLEEAPPSPAMDAGAAGEGGAQPAAHGKAADGSAASGSEKRPVAPLPRIDRIILYIDDLDRCPEDRVVQVLQAVHLLLAFPLFVVVVGVDSRWLLLSLEDHYAALRGTSPGARKDGGGNGKKPEAEWSTTPQNYLEKIFQIPFSLRPMESGGFSDLVTSLLPVGDEDAEDDEDGNGLGEQQETPGEPSLEHNSDSSDGEEEPPAGDEEAYESEEDKTDLDEGGIDPDGEKAKDEEEEKDEAVPIVVRTNPQGLTVGRQERKLIQKLHPLIASPRALKRFTNVYRFLRVQQRGEALARFRGADGRPGEFEVVALLLGAVVGYPAEAAHLLRAVLANRDREWWTLVEELGDAGAAEDAATRAEVAGQKPPAAEQGRKTLREALLEVKKTVEIGDHSPRVFADWTREVARFSFQSGRILSTQTPDDARAPGSVA